MNLCAVSSRSAALAQRDMGFGLEDEVGEDDEELKRALALSRQDIDVEDEEADLRRAIQLSMQGEKLLRKRLYNLFSHLFLYFLIVIKWTYPLIVLQSFRVLLLYFIPFLQMSLSKLITFQEQ